MTRLPVLRSFRPFVAAFALTVLCAAGARADVTVGQFDDTNCYPFSCFASDSFGGGGNTYQQVYDASAFSGVTSFNSICFFADSDSVGLPMDGATYAVSFSTTSGGVLALDANPNNNLGGDNASFGTFTLGGLMPAVTTLNGSTFTYDPSQGDLLMTVTVSNLTDPEPYSSFFQADYTGAVTSRLYTYNDDPTTGSNDVGALVTQFKTLDVTVPEPGAVAFGILAAGSVLGLIAKRKRT